MGVCRPLWPDSPRDQRRVFLGERCGLWVGRQCSRVRHLCLWSKWIQLHPGTRETGWVTTIAVALANSSICHSMTLGVKWLFPSMDSVPAIVWTTCRAEWNSRMQFSTLSGAQPMEMVICSVPGRLHRPSGIEGGTFLRDSPGILLVCFSYLPLECNPCMQCSFPIMWRTELVF